MCETEIQSLSFSEAQVGFPCVSVHLCDDVFACRIRKKRMCCGCFVPVVQGAWEQSLGPCYKLASDPCLCVAPRKARRRPQPKPQWERPLWRASFRGVTARWIGREKHVYRLCKGVRLCGRMSLTLLQFAWMNCDDEANGAPAKGEGQRGGPPRLGTPHPQAPFTPSSCS